MSGLVALPLVQLHRLPVLLLISDPDLRGEVASALREFIPHVVELEGAGMLKSWVDARVPLGVIFDIAAGRVESHTLIQISDLHVATVCVSRSGSLEDRLEGVALGSRYYARWPCTGRSLFDRLRVQHHVVRAGPYGVLAVTDKLRRQSAWLAELASDPKFEVTYVTPEDAALSTEGGRPEVILVDGTLADISATRFAVALMQADVAVTFCYIVENEDRARGSTRRRITRISRLGGSVAVLTDSLSDMAVAAAESVRMTRVLAGADPYTALRYIDHLAPDLVVGAEICTREKRPYAVGIIAIDDADGAIAKRGVRDYLDDLERLGAEIRKALPEPGVTGHVDRDQIVAVAAGLTSVDLQSRLQRALEQFGADVAGLMLSIGISGCAAGSSVGIGDVLQRARRALLRSRLAGNNTIVIEGLAFS